MVLLEGRTDKLINTHAHTGSEHTDERTHPRSRRGGCHTHMEKMLQILIPTHVLHLIYLITIIIIFIILIISTNYSLKLNETGMQLRGSNPHRVVQQLATIKSL